MPSRRGRPAHDDVLTPTEWAIVEAVRHGMSNPQIAKRRGVRLDAVKFHVANALQKLNLSGRAELQQWTRVRNDSALARQGVSSMNTQKLGPIGQIARSVKDIAASRAWYGKVLGLTHLYSFGNLAFFDCDGTRLFLTEGDGAPSESVLYFRVGDIRAAHQDMMARGIAFTHAPHLIHTHADGTEEWMAFFSDNEGRSLAIMSQVSAKG